MSPRVTQVHDMINAALSELKPLFTPDCELTFIMRKPGMPTASMIVSNDDLDELQKQIDWFKNNAHNVRERTK